MLCAAVVRAHGGAASLASGHTPFDADADMRHAVVDTEEPKAVKHCGWMLGQMSGGLDERDTTIQDEFGGRRGNVCLP